VNLPPVNMEFSRNSIFLLPFLGGKKAEISALEGLKR